MKRQALEVKNEEPFNLSILECKFRGMHLATLLKELLIYPYWNVNLWKPNGQKKEENILIYPYWNVN